MPGTGQSRRSFLKKSGIVTGIVSTITFSVVSTPAASQEEYAQTFEFLGRTPGWHGVSPSDIADETNPTLTLGSVGETYQVIWENDDGAPHNFHLIDATGNTIVQTEIRTSGTQELEFEAVEELAGGMYQCDPHAGRMNGDVEIEGVEPPEPGNGDGDGDGDGNGDGDGDGNGDGNSGGTNDDESSDGGDGDDADDDGPGFGVIGALVGAGASAVYAAKNTIGSDNEE